MYDRDRSDQPWMTTRAHVRAHACIIHVDVWMDAAGEAHQMPGKVPASKTPRRTRSSRKPAALRTVARSMEHNPHRVTVTASHTGAPTLACIAHHQPLVCGVCAHALTVPETLQPHLRLCCNQHGNCRGASWTLPGLCLQTPPKPSKLPNPTEQLGWVFRPPAHVCSAGKCTRKIVNNRPEHGQLAVHMGDPGAKLRFVRRQICP